MASPGLDDQGLLLQWLRAVRGWDQSQLGAAVGISQASISRYEKGEVPVRPEALERITAAVGLPVWFVKRYLVPVFRATRSLSATVATSPSSGAHPPLAQDHKPLDGGVLEAALRAMLDGALAEVEAAAIAAANQRSTPRPLPSPRDREDAARAWDRLAPCAAADRQWLVERCAEFHLWALAERLCDESARAAPQEAAAALDLARLALTVAQRTGGAEPWRRRLQGYARAFLANVLRVTGELVAAGAEFAKAWELWRSSGEGDPAGLLEEWRLLDLEASLRRDARQFHDALDLLERAAAVAPPRALGGILLNKASTLEQAGDPAGALAVLRQAAPLVASSDAPRLHWILDFNLCVNLCHLRQFAEAEAQLPRLRQLALDLGNDLDLVRVVWLSGRTAAGSGRRAEACAAFEQVRGELTIRKDAFGTAMVSLELAQLYLDEGRTAEVRELAAEMAWVLAAKGLEREALAALRLFCDAAQREAATLDQVRRVLGQLERTAVLPRPAAL